MGRKTRGTATLRRRALWHLAAVVGVQRLLQDLEVDCRLEELEMARVADFLAELEESLEAMEEILEVEEETAKPLARR